MRKVEILDLDGKIKDSGIIEGDNFDDTVIVSAERMGLVNVPKCLLRVVR